MVGCKYVFDGGRKKLQVYQWRTRLVVFGFRFLIAMVQVCVCEGDSARKLGEKGLNLNLTFLDFVLFFQVLFLFFLVLVLVFCS